MTRTSRLALVALSGLAACTVNPDKIKPTVEDLCREVESALADRYAECAGSPLAWTHWVFSSDFSCAQWGASVAAGRMGYDESVGSQCISDLRTIACDQLFASGSGPPGACAQAIWGLVPAGSACSTSEDCASGTYCNYTSTCGGTCKAYVNLGQVCYDSSTSTYTRCSPGLNCIADPAPATTSRCQAPFVLGAACPSGWGCAEGLYCDQNSTSLTYHTCRAQQTSGSCGQYDACLTPLYVCAGASISYTTPGNCQSLSREGQDCVNGWNECAWGTYCNTGSTAPATGVLGICTIFPGPPGACGSYGGEYVQCLASYCNGSPTGNCTPYVPLGGTCTGSNQCGPGDYCDTTVTPNVCKVYCP